MSRRCRRGSGARLVLLLGASFGMASASSTAEPARDEVYADELVARALAMGLSESNAWRALLHYEQRPLRAAASRAAPGIFFLSPEGRRDPAAELAASLRAFFETLPRPGADDPPQCAFVARFHWLDSRLGFDSARMPQISCDHYDRWREALPDGRLSLVFAEAFVDNPASMFGHTLLRLDAGDDADTRLLGYAIDFTADIGDDGVLAYLAKGPVGAYRGFFGVGPYYEKLERYADWENRNIWEYDLDLEAEEIDFLLMHLWELRGVGFAYWFFDDNCSYQLLRLLEVVRPEVRLADGFPAQVLPVDTVREVARAGWVRKLVFRQSPAAALQQASARLPARLRALAKELSDGKLPPEDPAVGGLAPAQRVQVLGLAYAALRYDFQAGRIDGETARVRGRELLVARSRLGATPGPDAGRPENDREERPAQAPTEPASEARPDRGHATSLVSLGGGVRDGDGFVELRIRPALHDFLDPRRGPIRSNAITILDTRVRYEPEKGHVRLEELVALDVASMSPWDRFLRPIAWRVDTGLRTRMQADGNDEGDLDPHPVWRSHAAVGLAAAPARDLLLYALGDLSLDVGGALDHDVSFGPGAVVGLQLDHFDGRLRTRVDAAITRFLVGDRTTWYRGSLAQRLPLASLGGQGEQVALGWSASLNRIDGDDWLEAELSLAFYF